MSVSQVITGGLLGDSSDVITFGFSSFIVVPTYNSLHEIAGHDQGINLVSDWLLQDDSPNIIIDDNSLNDVDGMLVAGGLNTEDLSVAGPNSWLAKALDFNGSSQYGDLNRDNNGALPSTGDWTIAFWAFPEAANNGAAFAQFTSTAGNGRMLVRIVSGPRWELFLGNDATQSTIFVRPSGTFPLNNWYHVVATREGNTFRIYVNTLLVATHTDSGIRSILQDGNLIAGRGSGANYNTSPTDFFNGRIAGLLVDSTAWGQAEVDEDFDGAEPVNVTPASAPSGMLVEGQTQTASTDGVWDLPVPLENGSNGTIITSTQAWFAADDASGTNAVQIAGPQETYTLTTAEVGKHIATLERGTNDGGFDKIQDTLSSWTVEAVEEFVPICPEIKLSNQLETSIKLGHQIQTNIKLSHRC